MSGSSKLLINEPALQALPTLACLLGLNEAIVLQQIQYWLYNAEKSKKMGVYKNGRWWIYNKLPEWRESNFPFWSEKTVQRIFENLREKRVVLVARLSKNNLDQTLYYTIDYDHLNRLLAAYEAEKKPSDPDSPSGQVVQMEAPSSQNDQMHLDRMTISIWSSCPDVNKESEITSEITHREQANASEIWQAITFQLESEMRPGDYRALVKPARGIGLDDDRLMVTLADAQACAWCKSRLGKKVNRLASAIVGREIIVEFLEPSP